MRYRTLVAALSAFAAFSAVAQPLDKRQSMEPVGSPFTYEALGATPSLRLNRQPRADAPAVASTEYRAGTRAPSKAASAAQSGVAAAAEGRNRPPHDEKK